ncbi:MAG: hypothetical protein J6I76_14650 [Oribacterium sp.]|nr:hypothetical protein [Oribacterium sp.]
MFYSARTIGYGYGINAQTMNRILRKLGYLEGYPGNYRPTEMAEPYVNVNDHNMATNGGYTRFNAAYETISYNEDFVELLKSQVTQELIDEVKNEMLEERSNG